MTWWTDDRALYWEQRKLDAEQEDARKKMTEKAKELAAVPAALQSAE